MIPKWLNAKRSKNESVRDRVRTLTSRNHSEFGNFEQLEEKRCLAFLGFFNGVTMDIVQTADNGDAVVENTTGVWRATDNAGTFTFVNATNISVTMLGNTSNRLDFLVDTVHNGNVTLNLGDGVRDVFFLGTSNEIGNNLTINGGTNTQEINLSGDPAVPILAAPLVVHGSFNVNLGQGFDFLLNNDQLITVDKNISLIGVNEFRYSLMVGLPGPPITDGNVTMDTTNEDVESFMIPAGGGTILGKFTYKGGVNIDHVDLGSTAVTGNVDINLGVGNPFFGDPQNVEIAGTVRGNVVIVAGDSNLGNDINLLGSFLGNTVSYTGGNLVDTLVYTFTGAQADVFAIMGGGDDVFELNLPVNLLEIDFGNDLGDMFLNDVIVPIEFDFDITNFQFFDHFYTHIDDTLVMNQLANTGDVVIANDGGITGFDWQMFSGIGGPTSTVRAENLILTLMSNTGNNLEIDLINPVIASITMNLGDGDRLVQFTGIANNPLRDIRINAGAGQQHVDLSLNHPLGVATLEINLGTGIDTVDDNANNLIITEDFTLRGVNNFENDGILSVFRDVLIDTTGEVENTVFANNASMIVASKFTYLGGAGSDEVRLNGIGGTTISKDALINLGDSTGGGAQSLLINSAITDFKKKLTVISTSTAGNDQYVAVAGTKIGGNLSINLGAGPNQATILGVFAGITASYSGGSGVDIVTYGMTGNNAVLTVGLGGGDDIFNLLAGSEIATPLTIDFGGGNDTFNSSYGLFDFNANLLNLNGFSHVYVLASGSLTSTQVSDPGNVTVDNNGPSQSIRFITGVTSTIAPANHITVNMLNGTSTNLSIDLDNALTGNLSVNLANGNRALNLNGTSNSIGGNLQVTGGSGDQTVEVAINNALLVGGFALLDLGTGSDVVDEDGNNISITGNLDFAGVNSFKNGGTLTVGGNVVVNNAADTGTSIFDDDATMTIAGDFTYTGGSGRDDVLLNGSGGTSIAGNATINVGDNTVSGTQFILLNVATTSVGGNLTVISTSSLNPDSFISDPAATIGGNIDINLGGGVNDALIHGVLGGSSIKYTGGSGTDTVTIGTTGSAPSLIVSLGAGADKFTLPAGAIFTGPLVIDFGTGADTFVNGFGVFTFDATLNGLHGFNHSYNLASATLTSTQVEDIGPITVDNNGLSNSIRFIGGGTSSLTPVTHLNINMLNGSGSSLDVDLDNAIAGNLNIGLGDGIRALNLTGSNNSIGADLTITGGSSAQTVEVAVGNALTVGGNALFNLGTGNDTVDEDGKNIAITGNLDFVGVNSFKNNGTMTVGGNLTVNSIGETDATLFDDDSSLSIAGNFAFTGGSGRDTVSLDGSIGTNINGTAAIILGDNTMGGTQLASLDSAVTSIAGNLTVSSTGALSLDRFVSNAGTALGGDIDINLGGGANDAAILGLFGGSSVKYNGGSGIDNVTYGLAGVAVDPNIKLSTGNDTFVFNAGSSIDNLLRVDFGGGNDSFTNNYGAFDFDASLLNWRGFDRIYDHATSSLNMTQIASTGNITLDNNGVGNAVRLNDGTVSAMTPASNIRLFMMTGTTSNVIVDFDSPQAGDLILQLRNGNRDVSFTGSSNSIGGLLRIEAADGIQNIHLAVTANLNVGLSLVINGRDGNDTVENGAHDINVSGAMILRGINSFENKNGLSVTGDFTQVVSLENIFSRLLNTGTFNVAGNVTYLGGGGIDEVKFNSGSATIGGLTYVSLGSSNNALAKQIVRMTGTFSSSSLLVISGVSFGGNHFETSSSTSIAGDVIVNFAGTTAANTAIFRGNYSGTYGTYRGGSVVDTLVFGANASNMLFAALVFNGNDVFTIEATASLMSLFVDFGNGADTLVNNLSNPLPFPSTILNLP